MAAVNAINLSDSSPFRDPSQIPLPNNLPIQAKAKKQPEEEDDEEGGESPSLVELAERIDSHVEMIDLENSATNVVPEGLNAPEVNLAPTLLMSREVSTQGPISWMRRNANRFLSLFKKKKNC